MTVHISDVVMNIRYFIATGITGVRMRCAVHGGLPEIFCRRHAAAINMMAISGVSWNAPALPKNGSCGSWCQNYHPIISRRVKTSTWTILTRYYELKHPNKNADTDSQAEGQSAPQVLDGMYTRIRKVLVPFLVPQEQYLLQQQDSKTPFGNYFSDINPYHNLSYQIMEGES